MPSDSERIRNAIKRALELSNDVENLRASKKDFNESLRLIRDSEELPSRIIGKTPLYIDALKELAEIVSHRDQKRLVEYVLSNRATIYDDPDFMLYMIFVINRHRLLRQHLQAEALEEILSNVMNTGLLYG